MSGQHITPGAISCAKLRAIFGAPFHVAPLAGAEEFERERLRLQNAMMSLVEQP